jgi:RNA polymerase sigma-70 factor (ECF subfamily)
LNEIADEVEWMRRIGDGDASAYRLLSDRHIQAILRYATRLLGERAEAEDVTQETFLRLWTTAATWQPNARVNTWLHRIAHNQCIDRIRRRRGDATETEIVDDQHQPSDLVMRRELATTVEQALLTLPERQRAAIVLVHYQGMTNPEAADVIGVGVEAVESLLSRGRTTLRTMLAALNEAQVTGT